MESFEISYSQKILQLQNSSLEGGNIILGQIRIHSRFDLGILIWWSEIGHRQRFCWRNWIEGLYFLRKAGRLGNYCRILREYRFNSLIWGTVFLQTISFLNWLGREGWDGGKTWGVQFDIVTQFLHAVWLITIPKNFFRLSWSQRSRERGKTSKIFQRVWRSQMIWIQSQKSFMSS